MALFKLEHPYFKSHPDARTRYVALVGCGKSKLPTKAKAREMYTGGLTKMSIEWAARNCERFYILSAKYGLLHPDAVINTYNTKITDLNDEELKAWKVLVKSQMKHVGIYTGVPLLGVCGSDYLKALPRKVKILPLFGTGMKMGYRMRMMKQNPILTDKLLKQILEGDSRGQLPTDS